MGSWHALLRFLKIIGFCLSRTIAANHIFLITGGSHLHEEHDHQVLGGDEGPGGRSVGARHVHDPRTGQTRHQGAHHRDNRTRIRTNQVRHKKHKLQ